MTDYEVKVSEASVELTPRDRIKVKDTTDAIGLDKATQEAPVLISVAWYAVLDIHNEKGEDKDYRTYIIVDTDGTRYKTGSSSFWNAFMNIFSELEGEQFDIKVYRMPSKNRQGKDFITCSLV